MTEVSDLFCITKESVKFEGRDLPADHIKIPNPKPRPMNKEGLSEDYFVLREVGHTVLLEVTSRSPYILSRVDPKTPRGVEIWAHLCNLGANVSHLLSKL